MPIDDCPHTFQTLATDVLPAHMARLREAIASPISMRDFGTKGIGPATILKRLHRNSDFSGCYVLLDGGDPIYVGISRKIVRRLLDHTKGGDYYTATLAYRMAKVEHPNSQTANDAMKDAAFMALFESKKAHIASLNVAFIGLDDPIEMYLFEVYCAMELDTFRWNSFRTH